MKSFLISWNVDCMYRSTSTIIYSRLIVSCVKSEFQENPLIALFVKNIAKRLQKSEAYELTDKAETSNLQPITGNFQEKLVLTGGLKEKLEQLDRRETELLAEIARLNKHNDSRHSLRHNNRRQNSRNSSLSSDKRSSPVDEKPRDRTNVGSPRIRCLYYFSASLIKANLQLQVLGNIKNFNPNQCMLCG